MGRRYVWGEFDTDDTESSKAGEQFTKTFVSRGYSESEIKIRIDSTSCQDRNELLRYKDRTLKAKIPCILTCNTQLPNIKEATNKHWDILKINTRLEIIFKEKPIMAFRRNRNLRDIIGKKTILHDKVLREIYITKWKGWCSPCNSRCNNLCCNQIRSTKEFTSNIMKEKLKYTIALITKANS